MKTKIQPSYNRTLMLTIALTVAGVVALLPAGTAGNECFLGYNALCSFAPISSLLCFVGAGLICFLRASTYVVRRAERKALNDFSTDDEAVYGM